MKTLLRLCALVCLLSLSSFGQDIWGSLPPAADCADGFAVTLKPQNPYSPQGGSFQLPGTYVCHSHVWYWQPPKVDSVSFFDATSMATATVGMLPLQTGHAHQLLDTNGTTAAWSGANLTFDPTGGGTLSLSNADGQIISRGTTFRASAGAAASFGPADSVLDVDYRNLLNPTVLVVSKAGVNSGLYSVAEAPDALTGVAGAVNAIVLNHGAGTIGTPAYAMEGQSYTDTAGDVLDGIQGQADTGTAVAAGSLRAFHAEKPALNGGSVSGVLAGVYADALPATGSIAAAFYSEDQGATGYVVYGAGTSGKSQLPNLILAGAAPTAPASTVAIGGTTAASTNCGSLTGFTACLVINVAGTTRYIPYK